MIVYMRMNYIGGKKYMSSSRSIDNNGRRYDNEPKLNYKKIFAVLIGLLVIIMIIVTVVKIIKDDKNSQIQGLISYFAIYSNNKWGVIDNEGNVVILPQYEETIIIPNKEKPIFICTYSLNDETGTYKTKVLNEKEEEILKEYDKCEAIDNYDLKQNIWYEDNVLRISKNGKYGMIDFEGKELLPSEYDEITALPGVTSSVLVKKDGKVGLVNEKGQTIIPTKYKEILTLKDGYKNEYIIVNEEGKYGLISTSGTIIFDTKYDDIKYINSSETYTVSEEGTVKLVTIHDSVIIDGKYDDITHYKGENAIVVKDGKYGVVDKEGVEKIPLEYEELKYAFSIYYIAKKDGKYGVVNLANEGIVEFIYTNMFYVESGRFIQADLSETETVVFDDKLSQKFTGIISEINTDKGYIRAYVGNEYKYYNFKFENKKSSDVLTSNTLFLSKKDGKYGYTDKDGRVVVDYIYDDATEQNKYGYAAVKKDGKWGSIDKAGKLVLEPSLNLDNSTYIDFIGKWHLVYYNGFYYYAK